MFHRSRYLSRLLFSLFILPSFGAAADLKLPTCEELKPWASAYKGKEKWRLNSYNRKLWLPTLLAAEQTTALFGKPILSWTPADAKALSKAARTCAKKAHKGKRKNEALKMRNLSQSMGQKVSYTLAGMEKNSKKLQSSMTELLGAAPSAPLLRVTAAVGRVEIGGNVAPADWRLLTASRDAAHSNAIATVSALRELPDAETEAVKRAAQARADALRQPVLEALKKDVQAAPETIEGLETLDATVDKTRQEFGAALAEDDYSGLQTAVAARRGEIEVVVLAQELDKIAAAPDGVAGLAVIDGVLAGPAAKQLSKERSMALRQSAVDRRNTITDALVAGELAKFDGLPGSLDGLRQFASLESASRALLQSQDTGGGITRFEHEIGTRKAALGRAAFDDFKSALAALPMNEAGLQQLDDLDAERKKLLQGSRRSVNEAYEQVTLSRRSEIAEAVAAEEKRLAALPLKGAVFANKHGVRFEFRNRERVYLTMSREVTIEGQYEEDGDRVIIRNQQNNMVMTKNGVWLKGHGLELKRQAE